MPFIITVDEVTTEQPPHPEPTETDLTMQVISTKLTIQLYSQTVEELDLKAVMSAVNTPPIRKRPHRRVVA